MYKATVHYIEPYKWGSTLHAKAGKGLGHLYAIISVNGLKLKESYAYSYYSDPIPSMITVVFDDKNLQINMPESLEFSFEPNHGAILTGVWLSRVPVLIKKRIAVNNVKIVARPNQNSVCTLALKLN